MSLSSLLGHVLLVCGSVALAAGAVLSWDAWRPFPTIDETGAEALARLNRESAP